MQQLILSIFILIGSSCFAQPNLDYYVKTAQQNSPLIKDNLNQSKANQIEAKRLKAFYTKPQVGVVANYLFAPIISTDNGKTSLELNSNGATNYYGYDLGATNGGTYQAMLTLSQPLFNEQRYKTANELLNVSSNTIENNANLTAHDLEKIIGDQYILCIQSKKQLKYIDAMIKLLSEQNDILKKLVESSIYKQSDLTLLNIEYQNFLTQKTTFRATYRRDLMDLNILCGISDTILVELQSPSLNLKNNIKDSAFLEKYRLDSLNIAAQQKVFELKYKPQVNFIANTGLNAVYAPTIFNRFGLSAGISINYNFFDGGQKKLNQNKIDIQQKTVSFYRKNFITQNTIRKTKILDELQSYTDRISIAEIQLKNYGTLMNSYKKEILSGQLSILNYITVLKNMAMSQREYTLLFAQQQLLINTYNYWNW